jgi:hypothetical protein
MHVILNPTECVCDWLPGMQVIKQIIGEVTAPWEGPDASRELLKKAGKLRGAILQLLERDPSVRLTVTAFVQRCSDMMSSTTQLSAESPASRSKSS